MEPVKGREVNVVQYYNTFGLPGGHITILSIHTFPLRANACQRHTVLTKDAQKKLNESPTLSVGPPKKPMEVPRTLQYKILGKSLVSTLEKLIYSVKPADLPD